MQRTNFPSPSIIRASEIAQWVYCQRAWWLERQGHSNENQAELAAGLAVHEHHARTVAQAQMARDAARYLLLLALLLLLAVFLAAQLNLI